MMDAEKIGRKLFELRGSKTVEEVATANSISNSALRMYENGHRIPRDEVKIRLAKYYGTNVEELFYTCEKHET